MKRLVLLALFPAALAMADTPPPKAHTVMMSDSVMSLVTGIAGGNSRYRAALIDDFDVSNLAAPKATTRAMVAFDCTPPRKIAYIEGLKNRNPVAAAPPDWAVTRFVGGDGLPDLARLPYVVLADWVRQPASRHGSAALPPVDALAGEVMCGGQGDATKEEALAVQLRRTGGFDGLTELSCSGKLPGQAKAGPGTGISMQVRVARAAGVLQLDNQWVSSPDFAESAVSAVRNGVTISLNEQTRDVVWGLGSTFVNGKCVAGIAAAAPKP